KLTEWRGLPEQIRVDNGPEFIAQALQDWCGEQTKLIFIQKGKPHQNGYIERFNRTYRDEVLNVFAFDSLTQARLATQAWMWVYNNQRPHSSLGYLTPTQFLLKYGKLHQPLGGVAFPTFQQDAEFNWDFIVSNVTKEGWLSKWLEIQDIEVKIANDKKVWTIITQQGDITFK